MVQLNIVILLYCLVVQRSNWRKKCFSLAVNSGGEKASNISAATGHVSIMVLPNVFGPVNHFWNAEVIMPNKAQFYYLKSARRNRRAQFGKLIKTSKERLINLKCYWLAFKLTCKQIICALWPNESMSFANSEKNVKIYIYFQCISNL